MYVHLNVLGNVTLEFLRFLRRFSDPTKVKAHCFRGMIRIQVKVRSGPQIGCL